MSHGIRRVGYAVGRFAGPLLIIAVSFGCGFTIAVAWMSSA